MIKNCRYCGWELITAIDRFVVDPIKMMDGKVSCITCEADRLGELGRKEHIKSFPSKWSPKNEMRSSLKT